MLKGFLSIDSVQVEFGENLNNDMRFVIE